MTSHINKLLERLILLIFLIIKKIIIMKQYIFEMNLQILVYYRKINESTLQTLLKTKYFI